jgi:hypothetical protein
MRASTGGCFRSSGLGLDGLEHDGQIARHTVSVEAVIAITAEVASEERCESPKEQV